MESESSVPGNVGRVDEAIRVAAVFGIVAAFLLARGASDPNLALMLVLPGFVLGAYLLLTSFVHVDPAYAILGVDTRHRHHHKG
jgi:hypothetical protein